MRFGFSFLQHLLTRLRTRRFLRRLVRSKGEELSAIRLSAAATRKREAHEQLFLGAVASSARCQTSIWAGDFYRAPADTPVARKSAARRFSFAGFLKSPSLPTSPSTNNSTLRLDELSPLVWTDEDADAMDPFEMWDYVHPTFVRQSSLNEWV